jgi:hypothetical protein
MFLFSFSYMGPFKTWFLAELRGQSKPRSSVAFLLGVYYGLKEEV